MKGDNRAEGVDGILVDVVGSGVIAIQYVACLSQLCTTCI